MPVLLQQSNSDLPNEHRAPAVNTSSPVILVAEEQVIADVPQLPLPVSSGLLSNVLRDVPESASPENCERPVLDEIIEAVASSDVSAPLTSFFPPNLPRLDVCPSSSSHSVERLMSESHHPFARENSRRWVEVGQRLLGQLYSSDKNDIRISFENGFPMLPACISEEIQGLHQQLGLGEKEREQLAHSPTGLSWALDCASNLVPNLNRAAKPYYMDAEQIARDNAYIESRNDYLAAILCITWALYEYAEVPVIRGSYTIEDQNQKLYELLLNYVKFANKSEVTAGIAPHGMCLAQKASRVADAATLGFFKTEPNTVWGNFSAVLAKTSQFAYCRTPDTMMPGSSHHKKVCQEQYGIDLRFRGKESALELFPNGGTHLLFGNLGIGGEPFTFAKIEEEGLGNTLEAGAHALSFAKAGVVAEGSRREKDNLLMPEWNAYCEAAGIKSGIKTVHEMVCVVISSESSPAADVQKRAFLEKAVELYGDNMSQLLFRTGHEVIVDFSRGFDYPSHLETPGCRAV